ncbi:hypothetical protein [Alsobacter soli]|uniref:hypothetical protein n=1 Tax=Alsobacter soli TaxID=2109933 RepID=UPI0011B20E91|nr:hypothetical protein [Alsobacter soli]
MFETGPCTSFSDNTRIKVEECGRKAVILNSERKQYIIVRYDGCVIKNQKAADYIIRNNNVGNLIVELKGKNVEHAVDQVIATADKIKNANNEEILLGALIVCTQFPRINTKIQKAKDTMRKRFNAPLHVVTKNYEFFFEAVMSFKGPHKKA